MSPGARCLRNREDYAAACSTVAGSIEQRWFPIILRYRNIEVAHHDLGQVR